MAEAARRGNLRQEYAEQRGLVPYGRGDVVTHTRGAQAEAAVAQWLGVGLDPDWTLDGDRSRHADVGIYHVRSSLHGGEYVWRGDRDYAGTYIFAATAHAPVIWLTGWLRSEECREYAIPGMLGDRPCMYVSLMVLHQLPVSGHHETITDTRAAA